MRISVLTMGVLLMFLPFFSCSNRQVEENTKVKPSLNVETDFLSPVGKDSILIDTHGNLFYNSIPRLDRNQYLKNRLFLMGYAGLNLAVIDTLGRFDKHITRRGSAIGEIPIGNNAEVWQSSDGGIYVLSSGNAYMLFVYDKNANFRYSLRLFQALPDSFRAPLTSVHFSEKDDEGKFFLTLAVGSTLHGQFTKKYYDDTDVLARFEINEHQQKIVSAESYIPYNSLSEIQESLKTGKSYWFNPHPLFFNQNNILYFVLPFSDTIYVFDENFKLEKKIKSDVLSKIREIKNGSEFFLKPTQDYYELTYYQYKNVLGNLYIKNLQVLDGLLVIQFQKPLLEKDFLPKFPTRDQFDKRQKGFYQERDQYWLIYNLENGEEELLKLTENHRNGTFLDEKRLLVEKKFDDIEGFYLMKYTLPEAIGQ